jgi:SAM-dependent methyltransferase
MERVVYQQMAELDDRHWWYRARRKIIAELIRREVRPQSDAQILEIGCGTGHNLAMLGGFGHVDGLELDDEARALSEQRLGRKIMSAPLPELAGVPDRHYDLIGAFDVIEHIDDHHAALASIAAKLKPGGKFVMTVPAHQWMWSAHDVVNHHKRRYSKRSLKQHVERSPMQLQ